MCILLLTWLDHMNTPLKSEFCYQLLLRIQTLLLLTRQYTEIYVQMEKILKNCPQVWSEIEMESRRYL